MFPESSISSQNPTILSALHPAAFICLPLVITLQLPLQVENQKSCSVQRPQTRVIASLESIKVALLWPIQIQSHSQITRSNLVGSFAKSVVVFLKVQRVVRSSSLCRAWKVIATRVPVWFRKRFLWRINFIRKIRSLAKKRPSCRRRKRPSAHCVDTTDC